MSRLRLGCGTFRHPSDNEQGRAIRDAETEGIQANRHEALPPERITAVETGSCPHTAVRDVSQNLDALGQLMVKFAPELLFVESGGDNFAQVTHGVGVSRIATQLLASWRQATT